MAKIFFSKKENGFFRDDIHKEFPEDIIEITPAKHKELMDGQTIGLIIAGDNDGNPILKKRQDPSEEERWLRIKMEVVRLLNDTDYIMLLDVPCSNIDVFKIYRQELRNLSAAYNNPEDVEFPEKPVYLCTKN